MIDATAVHNMIISIWIIITLFQYELNACSIPHSCTALLSHVHFQQKDPQLYQYIASLLGPLRRLLSA